MLQFVKNFTAVRLLEKYFSWRKIKEEADKQLLIDVPGIIQTQFNNIQKLSSFKSRHDYERSYKRTTYEQSWQEA